MSFNPVDLWNTMTPLAKGVCVLLILMSIYSLTVAVERFIYYNKAKKQSLAFATLVTGYLKKDQLQEAIDSSKKFKNSHLARVVSAGLYERSPSAEIIIKADQRLKYSAVKEVMKMAKEAGFQNVGLIADKKQKGASAKS